MIHTLWIIPLVLLIIFLLSPRYRGDIAETRVRRLLASGLEKNRYTLLNDITLPSGGGTVHIDHLVVSRFGIFVIESEYVRGWISGGEFQQRWKQNNWRRSVLFDNPAHRNALQAEAVANLLKMPLARLHPMVVLVGQKGFKSAMPANVLPPEKLVAAIRKKTQALLEAEQADRALVLIDSARLRPAGLAHFSKLSVLRFLLFITLIAGMFFAFREELVGTYRELLQAKEKQTAPEQFHADGTVKSEQELWEDSLVCAYSADTGRCTCYDPGGARADLDHAKCRLLAERGSILKQ